MNTTKTKLNKNVEDYFIFFDFFFFSLFPKQIKVFSLEIFQNKNYFVKCESCEGEKWTTIETKSKFSQC